MRIHVRVVAVVSLLLILASSSAQIGGDVGDSPALALLVHHPYPDPSDPFGVQYRQTGSDAYWHRYQHLDTDGVRGFDFPHTVFDGIVAIEGLPEKEGVGPYVATQQAYQEAYDRRAEVESPMALQVTTWPAAGGVINLDVQVTQRAVLSGDDLQLWVAVVEDPVHYEPPPALSNGVFVHPFVVRSVQHVGDAVDGSHGASFTAVGGDGPKAWDLDRLRAVAWVQQGPTEGLRFEAHEVVQAVMQDPDADSTLADQKVVLMEMYSATWCDTCLHGDRVAEEMAVQYGVERDLEPESVGYLRDGPWIPAAVGGVLAAVAVAWPRLPGGRK